MRTVLLLTVVCAFMVGMAYAPDPVVPPCKTLTDSTVLCTTKVNTDCTMIPAHIRDNKPCSDFKYIKLNGDGKFPDAPVPSWVGATSQESVWCYFEAPCEEDDYGNCYNPSMPTQQNPPNPHDERFKTTIPRNYQEHTNLCFVVVPWW